jgi:hypothetical protein
MRGMAYNSTPTTHHSLAHQLKTKNNGIPESHTLQKPHHHCIASDFVAIWVINTDTEPLRGKSGA